MTEQQRLRGDVETVKRQLQAGGTKVKNRKVKVACATGNGGGRRWAVGP